MPVDVRLYGIRHHGPGSARAVRRALGEFGADVVLIEGPREADAIAALALDPQMLPPVAMLGYAVDHLEQSVFYPFASFSPEWVALQWAGVAAVPVRFIDLALTHSLAMETAPRQMSMGGRRRRPLDPVGALAAAAGYDDAERWWEDVVEHRDDESPFESIAEAMAILRAAYEPDLVPADPIEAAREAQMRTGIRAAVKDGFQRVAVVCGAWHVPALTTASAAGCATGDAGLLRGLPKRKVALTWVPWTNRRLANASGYGAGVNAPGWYHHLFTHHGPHTVARWFAEAARVLRAADYDTSAADVMEATRLAVSLGALRGRPLAGLAEMDDAARAVLGDGTDVPMRLLASDLVVGAAIGHVPPQTPMVPIARDLAAQQRRCRLKSQAVPRTLELDLRRPLDLDRSRLLHRLTTLRVPWGHETEGRGSTGTFRETWQLQWEPELEVRLIEIAALGTSVAAAAAASLTQTAASAATVGELTDALEQCLLADLDEPRATVLQLLAQRAALDTDVAHLIAALPALARTIRYGDVRGTHANALGGVFASLVGRVAAGLGPACIALSQEASDDMSRLISSAQAAIALVGDVALLQPYLDALSGLVEAEHVHASLQGRATRLLADAGAMAADAVERRVSRALSPGTVPLDGAAFVEGFLGGSGIALVHDSELLAIVDRWLATLPAAAFTDTLPLLRRTFSTFEAAERRQIGQRIRGGSAAAAPGPGELDPDRVAAALFTIGQLLGTS